MRFNGLLSGPFVVGMGVVLAVACSACSTTEPTLPEEQQSQGDQALPGSSDAEADAAPSQSVPPATGGKDAAANPGSAVTADGGPTTTFDASVATPPAASDDGSAPATTVDAGTGGAGGGGKRCGTRGGVACAADQFCNFEPDKDCGGTDRGGVCEGKPQVCSTLYKPVCGCDNRSYSSDCAAHGAGVSVKHDGLCTQMECKSAGGAVRASTGANVPKCANGEEQWNLGGGDEQILCCLKKPGGPKPGTGTMCGGFAGISCDKGNFCNYEIAAGGQGCEGIADGAGVCEPTPSVCTREYNPVCGCDHRTYATACTAHAAGVSVLRAQACTEVDCQALGGKPVDGIGPAPVCPSGQVDLGPIRYSNGNLAIEGTICCAPR